MNFLHVAIQMGLSKKLKRSGWVREKIANSESIADHCFGITTLVSLLSPQLEVDQEKMMKMVIVHNFASTLTEDTVVERGGKVNKEVLKLKEKTERQAIRTILWEYGEEYTKIFDEMKLMKTKEANVFAQIDKLEMAIQAFQYEKEQKKNLSEFFDNAALYIKHTLLKKAFDDLLKMRK
jgi:5'-deoxynucleotidase YfbR-like HD superfamily hydrolase